MSSLQILNSSFYTNKFLLGFANKRASVILVLMLSFIFITFSSAFFNRQIIDEVYQNDQESLVSDFSSALNSLEDLKIEEFKLSTSSNFDSLKLGNKTLYLNKDDVDPNVDYILFEEESYTIKHQDFLVGERYLVNFDSTEAAELNSVSEFYVINAFENEYSSRLLADFIFSFVLLTIPIMFSSSYLTFKKVSKEVLISRMDLTKIIVLMSLSAAFYGFIISLVLSRNMVKEIFVGIILIRIVFFLRNLKLGKYQS